MPKLRLVPMPLEEVKRKTPTEEWAATAEKLCSSSPETRPLSVSHNELLKMREALRGPGNVRRTMKSFALGLKLAAAGSLYIMKRTEDSQKTRMLTMKGRQLP